MPEEDASSDREPGTISRGVDTAFTELRQHFESLQQCFTARRARQRNAAVRTRSAYSNLRTQLASVQSAPPLLAADQELVSWVQRDDSKAEQAARKFKSLWGIEAPDDLTQMFSAQHFYHKLKGSTAIYDTRPSARFLFSAIFPPALSQSCFHSVAENVERANIAGAFDNLCRKEVRICNDDLTDTYDWAVGYLKRLFGCVDQVKLPDGSKLSDLDWSSPHGVKSARTIFRHPDCWTSESAFYGAFTVHHITKLATKEPSLRGKEIDIHAHADLLSKIAYTSLFLPGWTYAGETWRLMSEPEQSHPPS